MSTAIDYYYAPISGYAYLGEPRLIRIAEQAGVPIRFRPVDIGKVFAASETTPPFKQPAARVAYRMADMKRLGERWGLPINPKPKYWPVPSALAGQLVLSAEPLGLDPHTVSFAMLKAIYAEEKDISDPETVVAVLNDAGIDAPALMEAAQQPSAAAKFERCTQEAVERGVFGSPTYFLGDEMFFGQDRLGDLAWRLGVSLPQGRA